MKTEMIELDGYDNVNRLVIQAHRILRALIDANDLEGAAYAIKSLLIDINYNQARKEIACGRSPDDILRPILDAVMRWRAPWGCRCTLVEGGVMVFESNDDYRTWASQK